MPRNMRAGETTPTHLYVYWQLVLPDGITPALGEAGGQPEISVNGAAWTTTGIGVLVAIGDGRYYAQLSPGVVTNQGDWIETRYASINTAECRGDSVQVVASLSSVIARTTAGTPQSNTLSIYTGEDRIYTLASNPTVNMTGFTVQWEARSRTVSFLFPPATVPIQDPLFPYVLPMGNPLVVPGQQPSLPTSGSTQTITKDNATVGGLVIMDSTNGVVQLTLSNADTVNLPPDLYTWQLKRVDHGFNMVLMTGSLSLLPIS